MKKFNLLKIKDSVYKVYLKDGFVGEFVKEIDGLYYFYANENGGCYPSWVLKELSEELNKLNENWNRDMQEFFNKKKCFRNI